MKIPTVGSKMKPKKDGQRQKTKKSRDKQTKKEKRKKQSKKVKRTREELNLQNMLAMSPDIKRQGRTHRATGPDTFFLKVFIQMVCMPEE